jgi:hypothetical protein
MRKALLMLMLLLLSALSATAQMQMMPLDGLGTAPTPPDSASFMWSWSTTTQMKWTSGYCYGLAAALTLLEAGLTPEQLHNVIAIIEDQPLDRTRLSILYSVRRPNGPWYVQPLLQP